METTNFLFIDAINLRRKVFKNREALAYKLSNIKHVSENLNSFNRFIENILDAIEEHLEWEYLFKEIPNSINGDEEFLIDNVINIRSRLAGIDSTLELISTLIQLVNNPKNHPFAWCINNAFSRICQSFFNKARIISFSNLEDNFHYAPINLNIFKFANKLREKESSLSDSILSYLKNSAFFFFLSYIEDRKTNFLQLANWGHEIGHFVDNYEEILTQEKTKNENDYIEYEYFSHRIISTKEKIIRNHFQVLSEQIRIEDSIKEVFFKITSDRINKWAHELFADQFGIRLFGPAAFFSYFFIELQSESGNESYNISNYPSPNLRLKFLLNGIEKWESSNKSFLDNLEEEILTDYNEIKKAISKVSEKTFSNVIDFPNLTPSTNLEDIFAPILIEILEELSDFFYIEIEKIFSERGISILSEKDSSVFSSIYTSLKELSPIFSTLPASYASVFILLNSGWLYWINSIEFSDNPLEDLSISEDKFEFLNQILTKTLEISEIESWFEERKEIFEKTETSVVDKKLMEKKYENKNQEEYSVEKIINSGVQILNDSQVDFLLGNNELKIFPILDKNAQLKKSSFDLRIGCEFLIPSSLKGDLFSENFEENWENFHTRFFTPVGKPFRLYPNSFVLISSLEYIKLPDFLIAFLYCRASYGRLGVNLLGPKKVTSNYQGTITMQVANQGQNPIDLYPTSRIAQLIFMKTK